MTPFDIELSLQALDDVQAAFDYYETKQVGLGSRFSERVLEALVTLRENPFAAPVRYQRVRCFAIRKFPHLIHYRFNEAQNRIEVAAIANTHRLPLWEE